MIELIFRAQSVSELQNHVSDLAKVFSGERRPDLSTRPDPSTLEPKDLKAEEVAEELPSAKPKRGPKAKTKQEVEQVPVPSPVPKPQVANVAAPVDLLAPQTSSDEATAPPKNEIPSREAAVLALQRLAAYLGEEGSPKGMLAAREVLEKFGAKKLSEVPEDKRGELIEACNAQVPADFVLPEADPA
jgi:outer membrane biosynthesis protein TonB